VTINIFNAKINIKKEHILIITIFFTIFILLITYKAIKNDEVLIDSDQTQVSGQHDSSVSYENGSENDKEEQKGNNKIEDNNEQENSNDQKGDNEQMKDNEQSDDQRYAEDSHNQAQEAGREIKVYVTGCVNNPGMFTLKEGQLLYEAIEAAGGLTGEADIDNINMVYQLTQNIMINILPKNISKTAISGGNNTGDVNEAGSGVQIVKDAGDGVMKYTSGSAGSMRNDDDNEDNTLTDTGSASSKKEKININVATADELATLPGIGNAIAESIVEYRKNKGRFNKIEDIMNVPGIKEKRFEQIRDFITVD